MLVFTWKRARKWNYTRFFRNQVTSLRRSIRKVPFMTLHGDFSNFIVLLLHNAMGRKNIKM